MPGPLNVCTRSEKPEKSGAHQESHAGERGPKGDEGHDHDTEKHNVYAAHRETGAQGAERHPESLFGGELNARPTR